VADSIIVGCWWDSADPDIYWFGLSVDNGVTNEPILLTPSSVVVVERQVGPGWSSDLALTVAEMPQRPGWYAIRTTIPPAIANGQERIIRLTVDGVVYDPWSFRFYAP
jgi:hypothetical protein